MASTLIGKQAVVIGARMTGLTAAGALASCSDHVVVVERDTLPSEPVYSSGKPLARHVDALLLSGQRALSELFPGFERSQVRGSRVAQGRSRCSRRTPGLRSFPTARSRLVRLAAMSQGASD